MRINFKNEHEFIKIQYYCMALGIKTFTQLENFYNRASEKGESLEQCLYRYCKAIKKYEKMFGEV